MNRNVGTVDRTIRIIIGLALLWYALLAAPTGYNWVGWIGIIPLATALIGFCPLYTVLGISTCPAKRA